MKVTFGSTLRQHAVFTSESARKAGAGKNEAKTDDKNVGTFDSLIPVQLPQEDMDKFVSAFHPRRAAKGPQAFVDEAVSYRT